MIVKTTNEEFDQKKFDEERLSATVDEKYFEQLKNLLPVQSQNMKNFHEV